MNVLHVTNAFPSANNPIKGVFIKEQIDSLRDRGLTVDVFVIDGKSALKKYFYGMWFVWKSGRRYDVIHAHHVFCGLVCILGGVRKKLVVSFLNDVGFNIIGVPPQLSRVVERWVQLQSYASVFKSPRFLAHLRPQDRIIPNGVRGGALPTDDDVERARVSLSIGADELVLLFVSANDLNRRSKRYDRFVEVVRTLSESGYAARPLVMVNVPRDQVGMYFTVANVLVVVSDFEGSPNAVKEALSRGLRVVSTDVGDVKDLIRNVPACEIVQPYDSALFAKAIVRAVTAEVSRESVAGGFESCRPTIEWAAGQISEIYKQVAEND